MRNKTLCSLMAAALLAGLAACGDDQISYPVLPVEEFTATLTGANEVPPVTTAATGTVLFAVMFDTVLSYRIDVAGLDSTTVIRVYAGAAGAAAGDTLAVLFTGVSCLDAQNQPINRTSPSCRSGYTGTINPNQFKASQLTRIPLSYGATAGARFAALLTLMRNGTAHVNIHNKANPTGHIRGQIQPM
jgi:hypothetical protein